MCDIPERTIRLRLSALRAQLQPDREWGRRGASMPSLRPGLRWAGPVGHRLQLPLALTSKRFPYHEPMTETGPPTSGVEISSDTLRTSVQKVMTQFLSSNAIFNQRSDGQS